MKAAILEIFTRDILKLRDEIAAYKNEKNLWLSAEKITNSGGNLCLHLIGNLNHFVGAVLGRNGYIRNRDDEFALKDIPVEKLISMINATIKVVEETLNELDEVDFAENFPEMKHDKFLKTDFMLLHLLGHFNYHLGQINYHRRLLDK